MMPNSATTSGTNGSKVEPYDIAFIEHLKAEAETTFGGPERGAEAHRVFDDIVKRYKETHTLNKGELYGLDRARLEMASPADLRAEAPGLYRRYCDERGEPIDPADPAMKRPTPGKPEDDAELDTLRARLLAILRALHWSYEFGPLREKNRVRLIIEAMFVMVAATGVLGITLAILRQTKGGLGHPFFAVLATVVYAGVMGGVVSCTRRLSEIPTKGDALGSIYALKNSRYVLYFAPLTGAVFAVITMLLFVGQILNGLIFPAFKMLPVTNSAPGGWTFTQYLLPESSKDYALLFLWCFIAGFAERFIPDTLSDLAQRATSLAKRGSTTSSTTVTENVVVNPVTREPAPPPGERPEIAASRKDKPAPPPGSAASPREKPSDSPPPSAAPAPAADSAAAGKH